MVEFTSNTLVGMERGNQTDAIYLDLAKAFDSVDVNLLIHKLKIMKLDERLLSWLRSYLTERRQIVKLNDVMSNPIKVTSETGQGYPIGATLFLLFIVDLPHYLVHSNLQTYADDTRFSMEIKCMEDCVALQDDINRIVKYIKRNRLNLNINKTKFISYHHGRLEFNYNYTIGDVPIERVKMIKDLGLILNENMKFDEHIYQKPGQDWHGSSTLAKNSPTLGP